jgi:hypothetical protein
LRRAGGRKTTGAGVWLEMRGDKTKRSNNLTAHTQMTERPNCELQKCKLKDHRCHFISISFTKIRKLDVDRAEPPGLLVNGECSPLRTTHHF